MFQKEDRGEDVEWRLKGRAWIIPLAGTQEEKLHRIKIWLFMTLVCWSAFYDFCFFRCSWSDEKERHWGRETKWVFRLFAPLSLPAPKVFKWRQNLKQKKTNSKRCELACEPDICRVKYLTLKNCNCSAHSRTASFFSLFRPTMARAINRVKMNRSVEGPRRGKKC